MREMETQFVIYDKSFKFSKRIIKLYKYLTNEKKEFVISKQILRSGTSIGANIVEAKYAQSDKDFLHKLSVSLKESAETKYWLELLKDDYLSDKEANALLNDNEEIIKILVATTKKLKNKLND